MQLLELATKFVLQIWLICALHNAPVKQGYMG